jgi:hypothetical protein
MSSTSMSMVGDGKKGKRKKERSSTHPETVAAAYVEPESLVVLASDAVIPSDVREQVFCPADRLALVLRKRTGEREDGWTSAEHVAVLVLDDEDGRVILALSDEADCGEPCRRRDDGSPDAGKDDFDAD